MKILLKNILKELYQKNKEGKIEKFDYIESKDIYNLLYSLIYNIKDFEKDSSFKNDGSFNYLENTQHIKELENKWIRIRDKNGEPILLDGNIRFRNKQPILYGRRISDINYDMLDKDSVVDLNKTNNSTTGIPFDQIYPYNNKLNFEKFYI